MPSGGTENKKENVTRPRRTSRGGDADAKTNDLSAEDWNFLLRYQGQQDEGNWTLALAERLLPVSEPHQNTAQASHQAGEPSPASAGSLELKEASLGEYAEQVQRWEQAQRHRAGGLSPPFTPAAAGSTGAGELLGVARQPVARSAPPLLLHHSSEAALPTCWPSSLLSSPTKAAARTKRETTSPCSTTAPPDVVPPWLGQAISFTTWFQDSRAEQAATPTMSLGATPQQFPSPGAAADPARTLFGDPSAEGGQSGRPPGRPRRQAAGRQKAHTFSPDVSAAWHDPGPDKSDVAPRGKSRTTRQGARGSRGEAAAGEVPAGGGGAQTEAAANSAGKAAALAPGRAGRVRWPSKRSLDAADEDQLDGQDSPSDRKGSAAPPSKAPKVGACSGAGGGAQKRQPGAAASSVYRGVLTQRWEASLWLSGKQMYLGGFVNEEDAARAYDLAALACKGPSVPTNFAASQYEDNLSEIRGCSREEIVAWVRRRSSAFSRGRSRFRGVSGQAGHWEARIGTFGDRKNVSFGIHETEEEAARQYDRALIIEKGRAAKTNFPLGVYDDEVTAFEQFVRNRFGSSGCAAARSFLAAMALPFDETAPDGSKASLPPTKEKNRGGRPRNNAASIIYASALQQSLATAATAAAPTPNNIA
ncbi:probable AP2-like ethylene-responsive transcription factor PLT2 at C-terminar half [Coccomyxa sp. Obi]|nr:probable AP2-like ethylene-responsive transcription factor PLT2 at C-terminar half [Coccomyxa sp. Obi]